MDTVLFVNKKPGMTSFDVCYKLRKVFNTKSIGHTGTLDPMAEGVMIILIGKATKINQFVVGHDKEYIATLEYGYETDTLDKEGKVTKTCDVKKYTEEEIVKVLKAFEKAYDQLPPLTSAIKVDGKKLYEYQRKGIEVEVPKREVTIYRNELIKCDDKGFTFKSHVSSGTYIRALVRDIMQELGGLGTLTALKRTKVADISINDCDDIDDITEGNYHAHDILDVLKMSYATYEYPDIKDIKNGKRIKIDSDQKRLVITGGGKALAVYEAEDDRYRCVRGLF